LYEKGYFEALMPYLNIAGISQAYRRHIAGISQAYKKTDLFGGFIGLKGNL